MRRLTRALVPLALRFDDTAPPAHTAGEPLILLDDGPLAGGAEVTAIATDGDARSTGLNEGRRGWFRSQLPRLAEVVLFLGLGFAVVVGYQVIDVGGSAADGALDRAARPVTSPDGPGSLRPMLIAPATARPGEMVTLLGYRHRGLSGELTVFLDGAPVAHQVTATINAPYPGLDGVILAVQVPSTTTPGVHEIELNGPLPGRRVRGGEIRGDAEQRDGRIATTRITIVPSGYVE